MRYYNRAILRTRVSENRTTEQYGEHCLDLMKIWDEIIVPASVDSEHDKSLRTVWIMGTLTTAVEMGFQRPAEGQEIRWLKDNKDEFEKNGKGRRRGYAAAYGRVANSQRLRGCDARR